MAASKASASPGPATATSPATSRPMLLSGNEAIARGAREAGVRVAAGYPGTPSTEILETLVRLDPGRQVYVEGATNGKGAPDGGLGGARAYKTPGPPR